MLLDLDVGDRLVVITGEPSAGEQTGDDPPFSPVSLLLDTGR